MNMLGWDIPIWLLLFVIIIIYAYRKTTANHGFFKEQGIPGPTPYPLVGTMYGFLLSKDARKHDLSTYTKFGKPPVIGGFRQGRPVMMVFNKDMLKQIMVKDFDNFINRNSARKHFVEKGLNKAITSLRDDEWKNVRHHMSPTFSSSKLKRMIGLINNCGHNLIGNLMASAKSGDVFEAHEYSSSYAMDVIASVAFGLQLDNQKDKDNIFNRMSKDLLDFSLKNPVTWIAILMPSAMPFLKKLGISFIKRKPIDFFVDIVERAITDREEHPDGAPIDFLQLMIESKVDFEQNKRPEGEPGVDRPRKGLTTEEILGQCMTFFLAGMSTINASVTFTLYHLAIHQEVQEKAYQEVIQVMGEKDPDYEDVKKLKYVEMCIDESLRIFSPAMRVDRECKSDTVINGVQIPAGMLIDIPIAALHMDPEAWPDPDVFDPERFTEDAKECRHPFQYMPFGLGPRMCVAQRLAMMETKLAISHILKTFKLVTCEKTPIPMVLKKIRPEAKNGTWLKVEIR